MINFKTTSSLTMVNATTKPQLTPTFNGLNKLKYFLALGFLVTLSFRIVNLVMVAPCVSIKARMEILISAFYQTKLTS